MNGAVHLVLHAHLPFIRHPEHDFHLEEVWFYEAVSETYLPLLDVLDRLDADNVPGAFTLSVSQPLAAMFDDVLLRERTARHLAHLVALGDRELERTAANPDEQRLARFYRDRFAHQLARFEHRWSRDLLGAFADFHRRGRIELITCVGTHGFMPLMLRDGSRRGQIRTALEAFEARTGFAAAGVWMGECAFVPGVDDLLAEAGVRYTFVDGHSILNASSPPVLGVLAPVAAPAGTAFFGRDAESSSQVWSATEGYPGDFAYREFYRDLGFDLPLEYIGPWVHPDGIRLHTGYKYHRITSRVGEHKELYEPWAAAAVVRAHAAHFVESRKAQLTAHKTRTGVPGSITCPYDAELFGHWWFEGPDFVEHVLRTAAQTGLKMSTPSRWIEEHPVMQVAVPGASSWGDAGYFGYWLNQTNAWIYRHLHDAEQRMARAIERHGGRSGAADRALAQCGRELLLAQSSDWAFIMTTGTAVPYADSRTREHIGAIHDLASALDAGDDTRLELLTEQRAERTPMFGAIDWRWWR